MTGKTGVLVANLGTPDAPTTEAVRRFLAEFLSDRRVVDLPPALWLPLLHGIILRTRPQKSARAYREIWTEAGSPLLVNTLALARALEQRLASLAPAPMPVATGMTYGNPSIAAALDSLARERRAEKLLVLPLYPQYSATTTASVLDRVEAALRRLDWRPAILFVDDYYDDLAYIAALAESLAGRIADFGAGAHLLFSFHGLPRRYVNAGDPYDEQCRTTARLVATAPRAACGCLVDRVPVAGRRRALARALHRGPAARARDHGHAAASSSAARDSPWTAWRRSRRSRSAAAPIFLAAGGASFDYVPALNDGPAHVDCLARIVADTAARESPRATS